MCFFKRIYLYFAEKLFFLRYRWGLVREDELETLTEEQLDSACERFCYLLKEAEQ